MYKWLNYITCSVTSIVLIFKKNLGEGKFDKIHLTKYINIIKNAIKIAYFYKAFLYFFNKVLSLPLFITILSKKIMINILEMK